jgi:UDP-N-acetylglucosamine diphosphorylase/glucosamine-1-phosphate N-acetyltransferase
MKAILFCAGRGTRLEPLTSSRPKHLLPVAGAPLIEHSLRALKGAGVSEVLLVVHHFGNQIRQALGDGSRLGLEIKYTEQGGVFGTGHALLKGKTFIGSERSIVVYGDLAVGPNVIQSLVKSHNPEHFGTMLGVEGAETRDFGSLRVKDGMLRGINEKPQVGGLGAINGGIYVIDKRIFEYVEGIGKSARGEVELTDSINKAVSDGQRVQVFRVGRAQWVDVGRPWNVLEANELLMDSAVGKGAVGVTVVRSAHLMGKVVVEEGAEILPGAYIEGPAWISSGCRVGPNCHIRPYSYLCRGVRVGNGCEVKASILMEGSHVGHLSYIGDSVVGAGSNLGAGTITANLRFDGQPVLVSVKGEKIQTGRRKLGAFFGDGVKTGINVSLFPGVKVGEQSWIGPHVALDRDVPPNTLVTLKSTLEIRQRR